MRLLTSNVHARPIRSALLRGMSTVFVVAVVTSVGSAQAQPEDGPSPDLQRCPPLYVLGVQGTGESSPDAPASVDDGMLSAVLVPLLSRVGPRQAGHAYVPYQASFGGMVPGGLTPYSYSAAEGLDSLRSMAREVVGRCPHTELGLIGYSQGAHVVSMFAREVGAGGGAVPADRVAAVALLADPTRGRAAPVFPGAPGKDRPDPAPDTTGTEVAELPQFPLATPPGGGIGPVRDIIDDFGALTGRVASLCRPGDLACDAPADSPLIHMVATIAGQIEFDPDDLLLTLSSIAATLQATIAKTLTAVVTDDLHGDSLGTLSLTPQKTLSIRLAEAADPRVPVGPEAHEALLKLAAAAFNTLLAITGTVLSTSEFSEIAGTAAINPLAGIAILAQEIASASHHPPPPTQASRLLTQIFDALGELGADNAELLDPHIWLRYVDTVRQHGAYATAGVGVRSSTEMLTEWFTAVARDLAGHRLPPPSEGSSETPGPPVSAPTTSPPALPASPPVTVPPAAPSSPAVLPAPTATTPNTRTGTAPILSETDRTDTRLNLLLVLMGFVIVSGAATAIRTRLRRAHAAAESPREDSASEEVVHTLPENITTPEPGDDAEITVDQRESAPEATRRSTTSSSLPTG
ncbi:cutinase family protein [Nocardia nova]|uniref:Cutinase family protein n=2 Tax=Nocardia TaxID=1817 RepID=A0A2T2ZCI9_9NOCA|nr:cutinase family protein [Nocardia elegans]PSR65485.1 cutinase family protein [Nocardia nova]